MVTSVCVRENYCSIRFHCLLGILRCVSLALLFNCHLYCVIIHVMGEMDP